MGPSPAPFKAAVASASTSASKTVLLRRSVALLNLSRPTSSRTLTPVSSSISQDASHRNHIRTRDPGYAAPAWSPVHLRNAVPTRPQPACWARAFSSSALASDRPNDAIVRPKEASAEATGEHSHQESSQAQAPESTNSDSPSQSSSSPDPTLGAKRAGDARPGLDSGRARISALLEEIQSHEAVASVRQRLMESSTSALSSVRSRISDLSSQWNTYSGYTAVEELKARITLLEDELDQVRQTAAEAKREYLSSVSTRSAQQKELNDLLARKNVWTEDDLSRYTQLLRLEHQLNKAESEAEQNLDSKEKLVQDTFDNLMKTVLLRYHEEQTWSDRVRTLSTWGSFAVAGLNAFLFILAILLVEPYKRKRLAQTFETRLIKGEEQSRALILSSISEFEAKLDSALGGTNIYTNTGTGSETVASASTSPSTWEASSPATEQLDTQTPQIAFSDSEFFETSVSAEQTADPETLPTTPTPTQPQPTLLAPPTSKREEERLVFASTVGVVVGAALSILIGACLGS